MIGVLKNHTSTGEKNLGLTEIVPSQTPTVGRIEVDNCIGYSWKQLGFITFRLILNLLVALLRTW